MPQVMKVNFLRGKDGEKFGFTRRQHMLSAHN